MVKTIYFILKPIYEITKKSLGPLVRPSWSKPDRTGRFGRTQPNPLILTLSPLAHSLSRALPRPPNRRRRRRRGLAASNLLRSCHSYQIDRLPPLYLLTEGICPSRALDDARNPTLI